MLFSAALAVGQDLPAASGLDGAQRAELARHIEGALKEGTLNYADTIIQPPTNELLIKAFRAHFGLPASFTVTYALVQSEALITRIEQEMTAGRVRYDVVAVGSPTWAFEKHAAGVMLEHRSPQYAAYKAAIERGLGVDGYFAFNGGFAQIPVWDSDTFKFDGTTWKDVADAVAPGRFSIGDVAHSMSHLTTYSGLRQILDVEYFRGLAKKKPTFIYRSEQSAQRVIGGQDQIALGSAAMRVLQFNRQGVRLKLLYPAEGFTFLPQSTFIPKAAPHPNAGRLWIDFILSETGQQLLTRHEALISGRAGFASPLPEIAPSFDKLNIVKIDWSKLSSDELRTYRAEWIGIFNP